MKTTVERITPTKALEYLARNTNNRGLREGHVEYLAQQIRSGNWQTTHQGIAFSTDGRLIDGQHRLSAIVRADKAVDISVTTGLPDSVFKVTDNGLKRATYDRIHLVNNRVDNQLLCQVLNNYCRTALKTRNAIAVSQVEDEFLRYADSWLWVVAQFRAKLPIFGRTGVIAAIGIYHAVGAEKAHEFCHGYRTGENLGPGSPMLSLRRSIEGSADHAADYWRAVSACRAHYAGRSLKTIMEATEDMVGNMNSANVINDRAERGKKAYASRREKAKA